jgi:hypothetical protein
MIITIPENLIADPSEGEQSPRADIVFPSHSLLAAFSFGQLDNPDSHAKAEHSANSSQLESMSSQSCVTPDRQHRF